MGGPVWHAMDGAVQPGRPPAYFIADEEAFQVPAGRPVVGVSSDLKAELRRCVPSPQPVGSADGRTAAASGNAGGRGRLVLLPSVRGRWSRSQATYSNSFIFNAVP